MFCTECGKTLEKGTKFCLDCGAVTGSSTGRQSNITGGASSLNFNFSDFINFRQMITPAIMKWVFILGSIATVIAGLIMAITAIAAATQFARDTPVGEIFVIIILTPLGIISYIIFLRILCEFTTVLFSIHKETQKLNDNFKNER